MGQQDILNLLRKHKGKRFNTKEIARGLKLSHPSTCLRRLRCDQSVKFEYIVLKGNRFGHYEYWL